MYAKGTKYYLIQTSLTLAGLSEHLDPFLDISCVHGRVEPESNVPKRLSNSLHLPELAYLASGSVEEVQFVKLFTNL